MRRFELSGLKPYQLKVPIEGVLHTGKIAKDIFNSYRALQEQNGTRLDVGWEERVWLALKEAHSQYVIEVLPSASPGVTLATALSFIRYIGRRGFDKTLVDPVEAKRRARICRQCPKREPILGCTLCKDALALTVAPPETLDIPSACGACGCFLPLKAWIPREHLGPADEFSFWEGDETRPACWMRG